jgi:hypothetical protein
LNQKAWHELSTSEWPVLIRPRLAGFEVTGDIYSGATPANAMKPKESKPEPEVQPRFRFELN